MDDKRFLKIQSVYINSPRRGVKNLYYDKISEQTLVHSFMERFNQKYKGECCLNYHTELLEFFNTITHTPKNLLGITINQLLIMESLFGKQYTEVLIPVRNEDDKLYIKVNDIFDPEALEFELVEAFAKIDDNEVQVPQSFEKYFQQQLILYGNLCYGRNYCSKKQVRQIFSCRCLLNYISNDLPTTIKAALIYILLHTHMDSKPRIEQVYPSMTHNMEKSEAVRSEEQQENSVASKFKKGLQAI